MADTADGVTPNGEGTPPATPPVAAKPSDAGTPPASTPDGGTPPAGSAPADGGEQGDQGGKGSDGQPPKTVPYSRFASVNHELAKLKAEKAAKSIVYGDAPAVTPAKPAGDDGAGSGDAAQFVTRDELHKERRVDALATEATQVAGEHDGTDGYPTFDLDAVTAYMAETGVRSYRQAYSLLNQSAIIEAEKAKAVKEALKINTPTTTDKGGSAFSTPPANGEVTREAISKMSTAEYQKLGGAKALRAKVLGGSLK